MCLHKITTEGMSVNLVEAFKGLPLKSLKKYNCNYLNWQQNESISDLSIFEDKFKKN